MGLEKVNSPSTGTIFTKAVSANTWTYIVTGLTDVISWELVNRDVKDFRYAYEDSPTHYRTNDGSGVGKDTALKDLYVWCETASTFELEYWRL